MLPLVILSILSVGFAIERLRFWVYTKKMHSKIYSIGYSNIRDNNLNPIRYGPTPLFRLIYRLQSISGSEINVSSPYFDSLMFECTRDMRKNHDTLSLLVILSPSFGLLGTVVGLMSSFQGLAVVGQGFESSAIANGVSQALTTTVVGLMISIFSSITLSVSQQCCNSELSRMEIFLFEGLHHSSSQ